MSDTSGHAPTIYVTNWSSHKTPGCFGPGRRYTIMARPREWEKGQGRVPSCMAAPGFLDAVRRGDITTERYKEHVLARVRAFPAAPQLLTAIRDGGDYPVEDGDTLCCACSRAAAAAGECHRVWVAEELAKSGWRVVLDGEELHVG